MTVNWRTLIVLSCGLALGASVAEAQSRRRPPSKSYAPIGLPDQAEGARILEASRQIGFGDSFHLEIELRLLPRRGAEVRMPGRWMGTSTASGPITRLEVFPENAAPEIWIIQGGTRPQAWRRGPDGRTIAVDDPTATIAGSQVSAADMQTPFMRWDEFTYEGMTRFGSRPTHVFLLYPPEAEAGRYPGIGGVRAFIDTQFSALSQVQWVDERGEALKTITAGSVRKVPGVERWIVATLDVRDEQTRDKTRIVIRAAALDLPMPAELFLPDDTLERSTLDVPEDALHRFN